MKTKLITTLKHLSRIMGQVAKHGLPLEMANIYTDEIRNSKPTIHNCGTPTCVVGYAALDTELVKCLWIPIPNESDFYNVGRVYGNAALTIWNELDNIVTENNISNSIFVGESATRYAYGKDYLKSKGKDTLDYDLCHLISDEPTAQDAKDWIDLIISIEEEQR